MIHNLFLASMNGIHKLGHGPFRYSGTESLRSQPPTSEDQMGGLSISTWDAQDMFLEERRTRERRAQSGALFGGMRSSGTTMLDLNVSQLIRLSSNLQLREEGRLRKRRAMMKSPEDECSFSDTRNLRDMVDAYQRADVILSMVDSAPSMELDDNNKEKILGTDTDIRIIS